MSKTSKPAGRKELIGEIAKWTAEIFSLEFLENLELQVRRQHRSEKEAFFRAKYKKEHPDQQPQGEIITAWSDENQDV